MATSSQPFSRRLGRYLGSRKNIAGSALALVGLALYFLGVIGPIWPFVVVALYAIGAILAPGARRYDLAGNFDPDEIQAAVGRVQRMAQGRLPADSMAKLQATLQCITDLLPVAGAFPAGSQDIFVIQRMATDYLPATLQPYLALPADYAQSRKLADGRTAAQALFAQLDLLDSKMEEISDAVHQQDNDRLLANGRFLEERFGQRGTDLSLPAPPPTS